MQYNLYGSASNEVQWQLALHGNSAAGVSTQLSEASNSSSGEQDNEVFIDTSKFYTCTVWHH